jgi:hypothetical protein
VCKIDAGKGLLEIFFGLNSICYVFNFTLQNYVFPAATAAVVPRSTIFYEAKKFSTL